MKRTLRRLRGALGNALVWAAAWFGAGLVLITGIYLFRLGPSGTFWELFLSNALSYATTMAVVGFVTGGAFSMYVAAVYRDKRLQDLSPCRFALGGGLVAVLLTLAAIGVMTGFDVLLLGDLTAPILISATLGSITGFGSIKMAPRALPTAGVPAAELESGSEHLLS